MQLSLTAHDCSFLQHLPAQRLPQGL